MSDSFVAVQADNNNTVIATNTENVVVTNTAIQTVVTTAGYQGIQGPPGTQGPQGVQGPQGITATISTASDVDVSTIKTGSLLIYDQVVQKWVANTLLSAQDIDAGEF